MGMRASQLPPMSRSSLRCHPAPLLWPYRCSPVALSAEHTHVPMSLAAPTAAAAAAPHAPPPPPQLPDGWEAAWSEEDGDYYFFREDTGEVTWDLPH